MTRTQAARYLGRDRRVLRTWERRGDLVPFRTPKGHCHYTQTQLDEWRQHMNITPAPRISGLPPIAISAIAVCRYLAARGRRWTIATDIAAATDTSIKNMKDRIAPRLLAAGITQGMVMRKWGGHRLAKLPRDVTLWDVMRAIHPSAVAVAEGGPKLLGWKSAVVDGLVEREAYLRGTTLADLAEEETTCTTLP